MKLPRKNKRIKNKTNKGRKNKMNKKKDNNQKNKSQKENKTEEFKIEDKIKGAEDTRAALLNLIEETEKARKQAEKERKKTAGVINSLTDGLIVLDKKGNITQVNPKLKEMFSIKEKELMGKNIEELKKKPLFSKVVDSVLEKKDIKIIKRKEIPLSGEEDKTEDEKKMIELTSVPILVEEKKRGYLLIFHDISREKLVEKLKTEFVSLSAHQLRTPLSGMKWTLKMLLDEDVGELDKGQKELLERLYENNERMIKLIADLLDVTKLEEGKYLYYKRKVDITKIVNEVIPPLKSQAEQKQLKFKLEAPQEEIPKFKMDKEKISICIQNLIRNAIKYTDSEGRVTVGLKYDKKKKEVVFHVKDTGMGIPKDKQKRVFTKFFRTSKAMKKEAVGSGLGLYMTKNIIEGHKGKVWFESKEGKGSTFYFSLPVKK